MARKYLDTTGLTALWAKIKGLFNSLATVATTGSYDDLTNKPTVAEIDDSSTANDKAWSASKIGTDLGGKVSKSGDTMTGGLNATFLTALASGSPVVSSKSTGVDASKANNGVSSTQYPAYHIQDSSGRILARLEGVIESNGNIGSFWYVRNYNTSGSIVGQKGIKMTMGKDGAMAYSIDDNGKFRNALDLATVATTGSYNNLSDKPTIPTGFNFLNLGESNHAASTGAALSSDTGQVGVHWYSQTGKIANQPTQYGFLLTCATSKGSAEQHSIFMEQANGNLYHMGTNGSSSGSPPAYKKIWDSGNLNPQSALSTADVSYTRSHASVGLEFKCWRYGNVVTIGGYFSCQTTIAANTVLYSNFPHPKYIMYFTCKHEGNATMYAFNMNTSGQFKTNQQIVAGNYLITMTYVCT